jgi:sugar phosphate isomerase/epimerase
MMEIGAQFYTVRETCKTLEGFAETLKKVADIGYHTVQISGTCAYEPEWLDAELKKNGLKCVVTHISSGVLTADPAKVAKEHDVFGCDHVGLGYYSFDSEKGQTFDDFVSTYGEVAKILKDNGKYFMYHNHDQEFKKIDGIRILDRICEAIPAELMGITFDTYWAQVGGADPAKCLEMLAGRIPCIHLKDCGYGRRMDVIGEGNINFERVFEKAEAGGTKYMLVEQDNCNGEDPIECLRRSYEYLSACGFH